MQPGADSDALENAIRDLLPATQYDLRTPPDLRRLSLQAFDRTFAITYLLELVAVLIGLFGIAAGISAQVLARRGEFGVLRHLGFTRAQIATMLAIEGAVLGAVGVLDRPAHRRCRGLDSDLRRESTVLPLEHGSCRARLAADFAERCADRGGGGHRGHQRSAGDECRRRARP